MALTSGNKDLNISLPHQTSGQETPPTLAPPTAPPVSLSNSGPAVPQVSAGNTLSGPPESSALPWSSSVAVGTTVLCVVVMTMMFWCCRKRRERPGLIRPQPAPVVTLGEHTGNTFYVKHGLFQEKK